MSDDSDIDRLERNRARSGEILLMHEIRTRIARTLDALPLTFRRKAWHTLLASTWAYLVLCRRWPDDPPPPLPAEDRLPSRKAARAALGELLTWVDNQQRRLEAERLADQAWGGS